MVSSMVLDNIRSDSSNLRGAGKSASTLTPGGAIIPGDIVEYWRRELAVTEMLFRTTGRARSHQVRGALKALSRERAGELYAANPWSGAVWTRHLLQAWQTIRPVLPKAATV